jgi:hypothetical protein
LTVIHSLAFCSAKWEKLIFLSYNPSGYSFQGIESTVHQNVHIVLASDSESHILSAGTGSLGKSGVIVPLIYKTNNCSMLAGVYNQMCFGLHEAIFGVGFTQQVQSIS